MGGKKKPSKKPDKKVNNMRTDAELKAIAEDLYKDNIFCDRHCQSPQDIGLVFMPLMFLSPKQAKELAANVGMVYEYRHKAMPRCINGLPTFLSMNYLDKKETEKVFGYYNAIRDAVAGVKTNPVKPKVKGG